MRHELKVFGFTIDSLARMPVILLRDQDEKQTLPVWVSNDDALGLLVAIVGRDEGEQGGDDLFSRLLPLLGVTPSHVEIDDVHEGILTTTVVFRRDGEELRLSVRPSEAILFALRYRLRLSVEDEVFVRAARARTINDETVSFDADARRFVELLERLKPEEMGKFPM
ncbi:MAG TPA: bifunctional nuclease domain-containing protein [Geobacterales bacterium]|nr:bifunctional nuclease domain-containing protein [Geobacterales bacterium]